MTTTRIGVVIDALVSTLTAEDGPPKRRPNKGSDVLYIGWDGSEAGDTAAGSQQEWAGLGNHARNENLTIVCYAESTRGNGTMKACRDAALATVNTAESALRSDPQLGGALTGPAYAAFGSVDSLIQKQTDGLLVGVVFTITAFARL